MSKPIIPMRYAEPLSHCGVAGRLRGGGSDSLEPRGLLGHSRFQLEPVVRAVRVLPVTAERRAAPEAVALVEPAGGREVRLRSRLQQYLRVPATASLLDDRVEQHAGDPA